MFDNLSYIGYTLVFCVPPLLLFWLRREFFQILKKNLRAVLLSTFLLTLYGSLIWPIALTYGAWSYGSDKITNLKLLDYVFVDDVIWWFFISLLFSSFVVLSRHYEQQGVDLFLRETKELLVSFICAFRGLRTVTLERNSTIHVAVATFVLLEGFFLKISAREWLFVVVAIGAVLAFELMNSAVERLASRLSNEYEQEIRTIKDTAAAGVLIASLAAAIIGLVILFSRLLSEIS